MHFNKHGYVIAVAYATGFDIHMTPKKAKTTTLRSVCLLNYFLYFDDAVFGAFFTTIRLRKKTLLFASGGIRPLSGHYDQLLRTHVGNI